MFGRTSVHSLASGVLFVGLYCCYYGVGVFKSSPDLPDKSCQEFRHPSHRAAWAILSRAEKPMAVLHEQQITRTLF